MSTKFNFSKNMSLRIALFFIAGNALIANDGAGANAPNDRAVKEFFESLEDKRAAYQRYASDRTMQIEEQILVLANMENANPFLLHHAIELLGVLRATEAVEILFSIRNYEVFGSEWGEGRRTIIMALVQIGKPASLFGMQQLEMELDDAERDFAIEIIFRVEGEEVAEFMLQQAINKAKNAEVRDRLIKSMENFQKRYSTQKANRK